MGNRMTRSKSMNETDVAVDRPKHKRVRRKGSKVGDKKNGLASTENPADKMTSCPDLGGAVPYAAKDETDLNLTLYRSYGTMPGSRSDLQDPEPEIRIYRRSTTGIPSGKTMSLPRSFGRKHHSMPNGSVSKYPELRLRKSADFDFDSPDSGRTSASGSMSSLHASKVPVTPSDFPNTEQIKRKLALFESFFVKSMVARFSKLAKTVQLSALPIAIHSQNSRHSKVSLFDYLDTQHVPLELHSNLGVCRDYMLTIPTAMFHGIMHVRKDKMADMDLWLSLARDLVACMAMESAAELTRMFEYQIAVIGEETSIRILAEHATLCVIGYMRSEHCHLDRNTMVQGTVRGIGVEGDGSSPLISIILGNRELKWYVDEVFKKPALRKEMFLFSDDLEVDDEHPPWQFHTSDNCKPVLYGYRGLMINWDYVKGVYVLDVQDEKSFNEEMMYRYDDFARLYCPYKRLIGWNVMMDYCRQKSNGMTDMSLAQFVRNSAGPALYGRDEVQPVYRPLGSPPDGSTLNTQKANLDTCDLNRMQLSGANLAGASMRNAKLQGARLEGANLTKTAAGGADMSYTDMSSAKLKGDTLKGVTVSHVIMTAPADAEANRTMVSDRQGNVIQVDTAIESKKREAAEEKKRLEEEAAKAPPVTTRTYGVVMREKRPNSTAQKIKKKKAQQVSKSVSDVGPSRPFNGHSEFQEIPVQRSAVQVVTAAPQNKATTLPRMLSDSSAGDPPQVTAVLHPSSPRAAVSASALGPETNNYLRPPTANAAYRRGVRSEAFSSSGRMVKSISHYGELPGSGRTGSLNDYTAEGYYQGRRIPSFAEVEYMRRSQVFVMIRGLQIQNIESNLPLADPILVGRSHDVDAVVDLASSSGRVVSLTGPWGVGKSALALSVARQLQPKFILPVTFDLRGCQLSEGVIRRVMQQFGLQLQTSDCKLLYNWLNCREQRFLFLLDNLDLKPEEDQKLSDFIDDLMFHVKNLRVICTSRRNFFKGQSTHESYRVGDIKGRSKDLLKELVPDLHEEGVDQLAIACGHTPLCLCLMGIVFTLEEIDAGRLFEELTINEHPLTAKIQDALRSVTSEECEAQQLLSTASCLLKCIESLPVEISVGLRKLASYPSFSRASALAALSPEESKEATERAENSLRLLVQMGLLTEIKQEAHYAMEPGVRLVMQVTGQKDHQAYVQEGVTVLQQLIETYHSQKALEAVREFSTAYDFLEDVVWSVTEQEDAYEKCRQFATMEAAIFLTNELSETTYMSLFESMAQQAEGRGDKGAEVRALCCMAYRFIEAKDVRNGSGIIQKAYEIVHNQPRTVAETDRALTLFCLGKLYWLDESDRAQAQTFVKKALDLYKQAHGMKHLHTLYTYELYGWMLTSTGNFQTARHFYNVSDFVVRELLDEHPQLIAGYDSRRAIWDKLSLFARATEIARKAARVAEQFYGEHPVTASMQAHYCESIVKRGSLNEAIRAGVGALSSRIKLLGDHLDTATSYKDMAYLMLRSGQYDESVRFSQSALDIYEKLNAGERHKIEMKNLMSQARYRLQYRSSVFVQLESKNASKRDIRDVLNTSVVSSPPLTTSVSTDV